MRYRELGRTGLKVSELGFGAVEIGMEYGIQVDGRPNRPSPHEAESIVCRALDLGVNVIDTARGYGESEQIIGRVLASRRDSVVLMSKAAAWEEELTGTGLAAHLRDSLETSLRLLATDTIDVYQIHSAGLEVLQRREAVDVLEGFREQGHVRFLGATVYGEQEARAALADERIDVIQVAYSLLDPSLDQTIIPQAARQNVGVVARSVFHRGVLTSKGPSGSAEERRLHDAALALDIFQSDPTLSLPHAALRFVASNPHVACSVLGMDSMEQVEQNLSFGELEPFSAEQLRRIRESAPDDPWSILPPPEEN